MATTLTKLVVLVLLVGLLNPSNSQLLNRCKRRRVYPFTGDRYSIGSCMNFPLSPDAALEDPNLLKDFGFDAIFQLGDSSADTGNLILQHPSSPSAKLPYGQDFLSPPTGRSSNGRLIIDYLAEAANLPLLEPYLKPNATFSHGVNFAVAGSTALSSQALAKHNISFPINGISLSTQVELLFTHLQSICPNATGCSEKFKNSLFIIGDFGSNDYYHAISQGKSIQEVVPDMIFDVVGTIMEAVKRLVEYGAKQVMIPGILPIGCLPAYLTKFQSNNYRSYGKYYCRHDLNTLAKKHNSYLSQQIMDLRWEREYPKTIIIYGDYYYPYRWTLKHAPKLGLNPKILHKACCGNGGGDYNFNISSMCGLSDVAVCEKPYEHLIWDGVHLTEIAYKYISRLHARFMACSWIYCDNHEV